jgi:hypothetical protein
MALTEPQRAQIIAVAERTAQLYVIEFEVAFHPRETQWLNKAWQRDRRTLEGADPWPPRLRRAAKALYQGVLVAKTAELCR